ncbi:penicillin-binding transpeptidase domain-containing protein [Lolliginicoccus suaedae]|uniref:penicillin-binding transpeptidase domain-containing protein n=1 Tax=Lolliginicoccus suaedae TaxID=2605429 RepID=UPI0011EE0BF2|nr:penicillin-binding transpeptidase domain-containing protein [Lolliginicoccus suaedae]
MRTLRLAATTLASLGLAVGCTSTTDDAPPTAGQSTPEAESMDVREDLERLFTDAGVEGSFVVFDASTGSATVVGEDDATSPTVPASTFKIPNSLIALHTGAVDNIDEVLPYGGEPQLLPAWERDMSMREALPISAVPIYQEIARRVGHERMSDMVEQFGYGNEDIGGEDTIDTFWLTGPLEITPVEQARFMARVGERDVPVASEIVDAMSELLREDRDDTGPAVYGKTGLAFDFDPAPGWYAGWVDDDGSIAGFALRIEVAEDGQSDLRVPLAHTFLEELGYLPQS